MKGNSADGWYLHFKQRKTKLYHVLPINAYNFGLVSNDTVYNTLVGNVYFEKGARSNWHVHPSGQILVVLDGEGYPSKLYLELF